MASVAESQALVVPAGGREGAQRVGVYPRAQVVPRHCYGVLLEGVDATPEAGWQHLLQLDQCAQRGFLDPSDGAPGGGAEPDRHRDRLLVVEQQGRQCGAGAESVATYRASGAVHRVAEVSQAFHVVADGAGADRQPLGQFGAGPLAGRLE